MLSRIARGVPRFAITSERLSLSTRFSSLPKLDLARRAEITMPSFAAVLALGINSPVHLVELYSYKGRLSMARAWPMLRRRTYFPSRMTFRIEAWGLSLGPFLI